MAMVDIFREHRGGFWTPARKRSLYLGLLLLALALVIHLSAGYYSSRRAFSAPPVGDIFLDNLPVVNLDFLIVGGDIIVFWIASITLFVIRPRYLLFGVKAIALFIIVRAFFTSLTHIGVYPNGILPGIHNTGFAFYRLTNFEGSLFFSGHTGFPFLMALIFWNNIFLRRFFIAVTVVFGAAMLLAHVHYSIDVFAAPFIVYSIFAIAAKLFPRDHALVSDA
jgi:hypothetical protein